MMLLWTSTVHVDKRMAIAQAIHFYDSQQKILIFVLETGEMWDKLTVPLILCLICLRYVMISNWQRKIGARFWNLGCKYDGWVIENNALKLSQEAMQLYVLEKRCCLWKIFQRVLIYMTCPIHCPPIHFRYPPRRGVLKTGFLLRKPLLQYAEATMEISMFSPQHHLIQFRLSNKLTGGWKYKPLQ